MRLAAIALQSVPTVSIERVTPALRSIPSTPPHAYSRYRCQNNSRSLPLHCTRMILHSPHSRRCNHVTIGLPPLLHSHLPPPQPPSHLLTPHHTSSHLITPPHTSSPLGLLGVRCRRSSAQRQSRSCAARRLLQTLLLHNSRRLRCSRRARNIPGATRVHPPTNHGHGLSRSCRAAG